MMTLTLGVTSSRMPTWTTVTRSSSSLDLSLLAQPAYLPPGPPLLPLQRGSSRYLLPLRQKYLDHLYTQRERRSSDYLWRMEGNYGPSWAHGHRRIQSDVDCKRNEDQSLVIRIRWAVQVGQESSLLRESTPGLSDDRIPVSTEHTQLHPTLPITTHKFHVLHGCTSHGQYESSAMFFRYDPNVMALTPMEEDPPEAGPSRRPSLSGAGREFLFFGDLESDWRREGDEDWDQEGQTKAREYNEAIWSEAAESWDHGRLAAVFVGSPWDCANDRLNVLTIRTDRLI